MLIKFTDGEVIEHKGSWKIHQGVLDCEGLKEKIIETYFPLEHIYRIDIMED